MLENHNDFFEKLAKLCDEYQVTILDSGSVRKGIEVTFYEQITNSTLIDQIVYEKFEAGPMFVKVTDEDGEVHSYK